MQQDIDRLLSLPQKGDWQVQVSLPKSHGDKDLLPVQRQALTEAQIAGGFFGNLPVGTGKTLIAMLLPEVMKASRPLLLVEASYLPVLEQEREKWSTSFKIPEVEVLTYEKLSHPNSRRLLFSLAPDLIVADEGHNLKDLNSVRTKRIIEYMIERPRTTFAVMSGTMTSRSITEYAHLLELALGDEAPIPLEPMTLGRWARTIDPWSAKLALDPPRPVDWSSVSALVGWYAKALGHDERTVIEAWRKQSDKERREDTREALYERLRRTPGVMLESSGSFDGALNIYPVHIPVPLSVRETKVEALQGGTKLDAHRHAVTLTQGFYYEWDWPDGIEDKTWLMARRRYQQAVEQVMEEDPEADSPALAAGVIKEDPAYEDLRPLVETWELVRHRQPPTKAVWIDHFLIEDVVRRAKKLQKCIIWYEHRAVGEALQEAGIPTYGPDGGMPTEDIVALSRHVYGVGWNLQNWSKQIIMLPPSNGKIFEQLLGRTHRRGQEADSIETYLYLHDEISRNFLEQALRDTRYMAETHGAQTKLGIATMMKKEN